MATFNIVILAQLQIKRLNYSYDGSKNATFRVLSDKYHGGSALPVRPFPGDIYRIFARMWYAQYVSAFLILNYLPIAVLQI